MKKLKLICMALLAMAAMVSCRGPQGPQGPMGNANVASSTVNVTSNQWYWDNGSWRVDIDYRAINADINDYGAVLVYMEDGNAWHQIPMTYYYSEFEDDVEYYYAASIEVASYTEGVSLFWTESDFYSGNCPEFHRFKIVVIAANLYNSRSDVNYSDYNAVKTAFQLEER